MKTKFPILILTILLLAACQTGAVETPIATPATAAKASTTTTIPSSSPTPTLAPELQRYLDQAVGLIQKHSVYSDGVNWEAIRQQANQAAVGARTYSDLYPVLEMVLHASGDRHGYVMPPSEASAYFEDASEELIPEIKSELIHNRIGRLSVPTFLSGNLNVAVAFADQLQDAIRSLDMQGACGWVIDLRGNEGGNGFAMLLGVSPLAQEGTVGAYTYNDGLTREWVLRDNQVLLGDEPVMEMDLPGYHLKNPGAPVAILTGPATTSAGEFLAIAFRGWDNTRSFGQKTLGRTTAPQGYQLEDGAMLGISAAYFTDHNGMVYMDKVTPEQVIAPLHGNPNYMDFNVPTEAIDWLFDQPACTGQ